MCLKGCFSHLSPRKLNHQILKFYMPLFRACSLTRRSLHFSTIIIHNIKPPSIKEKPVVFNPHLVR